MGLTIEEKRRAVFSLNSIMHLTDVANTLPTGEKKLIIDFLTEKQEEYGKIPEHWAGDRKDQWDR